MFLALKSDAVPATASGEKESGWRLTALTLDTDYFFIVGYWAITANKHRVDAVQAVASLESLLEILTWINELRDLYIVFPNAAAPTKSVRFYPVAQLRVVKTGGTDFSPIYGGWVESSDGCQFSLGFETLSEAKTRCRNTAVDCVTTRRVVGRKTRWF